MKLILILSFLFTFSAQASEVKLFLDRPSILTGELISGKVDGYLGPEIHEKMLEDSVYIVHLSEERADLVFMKPMSSNTISLNEKDYLVWNPIEIIPV